MQADKRIWTIPNLLSLVRLVCLIPILVFLARGERLHALVFIFIGFTSDFLDGWIARRFHQSSDLGRMMDPLIDKLNILSVGLLMVLLPALYHFPLWYFLFLLVRELAVLAGGLWIVRKRKVVLESNRPGKLSSFFTGVCVLCFILDLGTAGWVMLWIALGLALVSTWIYAAAFARAVKGRIPRTIRSE